MEMLLFVVFAALVGGCFLMLYLSYADIEQRRAAEERELQAEASRTVDAVASLPRFFVAQGQRPTTGQPALDQALLDDLERFLKSEQVVVSQFVAEPSIETLFQIQPPAGELN